MKHQINIHLLISASLFLIILGQGLQNWAEFSSIRQWLTGVSVATWIVHLCITFILLFKNRPHSNFQE